DHPVERFQVPAIRDELVGQGIEQLRMARPRAVDAKIIGSLDEAPAKMVLPDPIDQYAGSQGMLALVEPMSQRRSRLLGIRSKLGRLLRHEGARSTQSNQASFLVGVAALEHMDRRTLHFHVADATNRRQRWWQAALDLVQLFFRLSPGFSV